MRSLIAFLCLSSGLSLAQHPEVAPKSPKPPIQNVDFGDTTIPGERVVPIGEIYSVPPKAKFRCLIQVRMNFDDKLRESVHEM